MGGEHKAQYTGDRLWKRTLATYFMNPNKFSKIHFKK